MLKRLFLAAALTGLVAGASFAVNVEPAEARPGSGCREAAKVKFSGNLKSRVAYKRECKTHWKAYKSAHGKKGRLFSKKSA